MFVVVLVPVSVYVYVSVSVMLPLVLLLFLFLFLVFLFLLLLLCVLQRLFSLLFSNKHHGTIKCWRSPEHNQTTPGTKPNYGAESLRLRVFLRFLKASPSMSKGSVL